MSDSARKVVSGRYHKSANVYLDHDDGGYTNSFRIMHGEKNTGINVCASGHSRKEGSYKSTITFDGKLFATIREAIFAYEDTPPK